MINKDEIKELLFDCLGIKDNEWALKLGMSSFQLTYYFIEKMLQTGKPFIVEGNFRDEYSTKAILDITSRFNYRILQLFCYADEKTLYDRFICRDASGYRHPGHIKLSMDFEEYKKGLNIKGFKLNLKDCTNIDINTTTFEEINIDRIYNEVEKKIFDKAEI